LYSSLSWIEWFERLDRVLDGARQDIRALVRSSGSRGFAALERAKRQLCALNTDLTRLDLDVISPAAGTLAANPADGLQKALETTVVQLGAAVDLPAGTPAGVRNRALAAIDAALRDSGDEAAHLLRPRRLRA
jgi:hypothetical protein